MKAPKLNPNNRVYVIYDNSIFLKSAAYIGEYSFIVGGYQELNYDAQEWFFDDYGTTWFTSLGDAKKFLKQDNLIHGRMGKIVQRSVQYWDFVEGDVK